MRFVVVTVLVASLSIARAEPGKSSANETPGEDASMYSCKKGTTAVAVTFKPETDVAELVTWVMGFTCKKLVLDPRIVSTSRKVTLAAPTTMTPAEGYRLFLGALKTIGLAVVVDGDNLLRIVEAKAVKGEHVPFARGTPGVGDEVIRYVVRPTYVTPTMLQQAFSALRSEAGDIQLVGSLVLVVDYASHVRDMIAFAKLVDVPTGSDGLYAIPVQHADAKTVADEVNALLAAPGAPATPSTGRPPETGAPATAGTLAPTKIVVDARTNTLLVAASEPAYQRVRALVEKLDPDLGMDDGATMHVYRLHAAIAEEMQKTLADALQKGAQQQQQAGGVRAPGAPPPQTALADRLGSAIEGPVKVTADKASNALVITSSGRDFLALREIIRELDQPRRQVYIEALILEVNVQNDLQLGVSFHGGVPTGGNQSLALGGVQLPDLSSTNPASLATASGLIGGILGTQTITSVAGLGTTIPSYGLLVQAFADHKNTNIVSAPSMIALDNEEAKYKIGINVPYQKGLPPTVAGSTVISSTPVDRMPLLLELNIKPHIAADDTVMLEVTHSSKDLVSTDQVLGPTWSERGLETRVVVKDQRTVAIGGLMQTHDQVEVDKVPILGDIPLLGYLFRYTKKQKLKTNLVILLTPYIIRDHSELEAIRAREVRQYDELVRSYHLLDSVRYEPKVDYRRKRGLVEEINRAVVAVDEDIADRARIERARTPRVPMPIEPAAAAP